MATNNQKKPKSVRRVFTVTKSAPAVPAGSYEARLVRFEEERSKAFGQLQLKAVFEITSPKRFVGRELARWANLENDAGEPIAMTEKSGIFKLFRELRGGKLSVDDEVDCQDYVDSEFALVVNASDTGFAKITAILPAEHDADGQDGDDEEEEIPAPRRKRAPRAKRKASHSRSLDPDDIPFDAPDPDEEDE